MKEEQPNFDIMKNVKEYLKNNLRVELNFRRVEIPNTNVVHVYEDDIVIRLYLDDEEISKSVLIK